MNYTRKEKINEKEAMELVKNAILSGINNDLGSGSNVDLCVITREKTVFHRNIFKTQIPHKKDFEYRFKRGTTQIMTSKHGIVDSNNKLIKVVLVVLVLFQIVNSHFW